jgi:hypothetical protein
MALSVINFLQYIWYLFSLIAIHILFIRFALHLNIKNGKKYSWIGVLSPFILNLVIIAFVYVLEINILGLLLIFLIIYNMKNTLMIRKNDN